MTGESVRRHLQTTWWANELELNRLYRATGLDPELHSARIEALEVEQDHIESLVGLDHLTDANFCRWSGARWSGPLLLGKSEEAGIAISPLAGPKLRQDGRTG